MTFLCLLCTALNATQLTGTTSPIAVDADAMEIDAQTDLLLLPNARITQGNFQIKAQEARATGLNFENSEWTFSGAVEITSPDMSSQADLAKVSFANNEITQVHISGSPAQFSQRDAQQHIIAHGHAGTIHYNLSASTVRLSEDAWITYNQNEFSGETVVYDIAQQRILADRDAQQGKRVRITITPGQKPVITSTPAP